MNFIIEPLISFFTDTRICVSAIFMLTVTLFCLIWYLVSKKTGKRKIWVFTPMQIFYAGVAVSAFMLFCPHFFSSSGNWIIAALDSFAATAKMFGFDHKASEMLEYVFDGEPVHWLKTAYVSLIAILVPCLTVRAVFSIFKETYNRLVYFFKSGNSHIFSELNEKSLCLARDIRKSDKKAVIVFADAHRNSSKKENQGLFSEAEELKPILTKRSVYDFNFFLQRKLIIKQLILRKEREYTLYLIDEEETDNVKIGINLYNTYYEKNLTINVFSSLESSEAFVDDAVALYNDNESVKAKLNLVNQAQIIAYDLMLKHPMFVAADRCNSDTISVLVVGTSNIALECFKAAMWCGVMRNYKFKIRIVDSKENKTRFDYRFADIAEEFEKAGVKIAFEYKEAQINSAAFIKEIQSCCDANYIIVATDNDELTINTASVVYREIIREQVRRDEYVSGAEPTIIPVICNIDYYEAFVAANKNANLTDVFYPCGCYCDIYKTGTITDWVVDKMGSVVNALYSGKREPDIKYYSLTQTKKRSNRANAVHTIYKLKDIGIDICFSDNKNRMVELKKKGKIKLEIIELEKLDKYISELKIGEEKAITFMNKLEHDRWSVFQIMDGWKSWNVDEILSVYGPAPRKRKQQHEGVKLHGCLMPYDGLGQLGETLFNDSDEFIKYDRQVVEFVGTDMIKQMNEHLKNTAAENLPDIQIFS